LNKVKQRVEGAAGLLKQRLADASNLFNDILAA
jgi:hypothetical protein